MYAPARSVRMLTTVLIICALASPVGAIEVDISGQRITIPSPTGFSEVGSISPNTFSMFEALLPAGSRLLAVFVSHEDVGRLLRKEQAGFQQYMLVQSDKTLEEFTLGKSEFGELRAVFRREFEKMVPNSRGAIDATVKKAEETVSKRLGTQVGMKMDKMVCLGVDSETASSISASLLITYVLSTANGRVQSVMAGTLTTVLVKGKVFRLCVYRRYENDTDLLWAREQSEGWFKGILAANETTWPAASGKIVPQGTAVTSTAKELLSEEWLEYRLKSHPKAQGLDISLKYPRSWKTEEAIRPHIVQKFMGQSANGVSAGCMVVVQDLPSWAGLLLQGKIGTEVLLDNVKEILPANAAFIDGGQTELDGESGVWLKFSYEVERAGVRARMYSLQYLLFCQKKMLAVQCDVVGTTDNDEILRDTYTSYLPVFQMIGNNLVVNDKWTSNSITSFNGLMEHLFGSYWHVALLLVAVLTFGLGVLLPLLIRLLLRHPMAKRSSVLYIMNFLILNAALVFFTGYDRLLETLGTLLIVSMVPYGILRRGKDEYEQEFSRRKAKDLQQLSEGQTAVTLNHLLQEEHQKRLSTDDNERYMPPEMRTNDPPEGDERYMPPEMRTSLKVEGQIAATGRQREAIPEAEVVAIPAMQNVVRRSGSPTADPSWEPSYGGIGRLTYVLGVFGVTVIYACLHAVTTESPEFIWVASILPLAILLPLMVARLHNIGTSGWWIVLMFIPIANLIVSIPCLVCPAGYSYTKKLDVAGKVLSCLGICLLVLLVVIGLFSSI